MPAYDGCTCSACINMCKSRPCWPEPAEAQAIIKAGLGHRLMRDYWIGDGPNDNDIQLLSPAIQGYEGKYAPFFPHGTCTFLSDADLCQLHDLGLKPREGREAWCAESGIPTPPKLHWQVAMTWNNPAAQAFANDPQA